MTYRGIEALGGYNKVMSLVNQAKSWGVFKSTSIWSTPAQSAKL